MLVNITFRVYIEGRYAMSQLDFISTLTYYRLFASFKEMKCARRFGRIELIGKQAIKRFERWTPSELAHLSIPSVVSSLFDEERRYASDESAHRNVTKDNTPES